MDPSSDEDRADDGRRMFATTQWTLVLAAGRQSSPDSARALACLCERYWHPLYAYVRRRIPDVHDAHDLTQAFFAELLEKNYVGTATPERGRFRAFLLTACKHFLSKQREKAKAQKRGGGRPPLSLDFDSADSALRIDPASTLTAEQFFDQQWAIALLNQAMGRLQEEWADKGKSPQFDALKAYLIGDPQGATYSDVAQQLNISVAAAKQTVSRLRRRYRDLLREEIAQTVHDETEVEEEIRDLFAALQPQD